jgi:hypothetical protein
MSITIVCLARGLSSSKSGEETACRGVEEAKEGGTDEEAYDSVQTGSVTAMAASQGRLLCRVLVFRIVMVK